MHNWISDYCSTTMKENGKKEKKKFDKQKRMKHWVRLSSSQEPVGVECGIWFELSDKHLFM